MNALEVSHDAEPCIVCGAPIAGGLGHDVGCMASTGPALDPDRHDVGIARARARAYADAVRRHDARANEARAGLGHACFDALGLGATSGELAVDTGFVRQYVERLAREAWRAAPTDPEEES